jgi:hypothetical protein
MLMQRHTKENSLTITKVLNVLRKIEQQKDYIQGPDEAKRKTNIKAIQS